MNEGLARLSVYKSQIRSVFTEFTDKKLQWRTEKPGTTVQEFTAGQLHKLEALLSCDPERLFKLVSDRHYVTRSQWDARAAEWCPLQQAHFETDDGSVYALAGEAIQWVRPKGRISLWVFPTCQVCAWVKPVDDKAFLIVISNRPITIDWACCQHICQDIVKFNQIYRPWPCAYCRKDVPAHELYCRQCKKERHKRCPDLACYEPQMENASECWKCKTKIE